MIQRWLNPRTFKPKLPHFLMMDAFVNHAFSESVWENMRMSNKLSQQRCFNHELREAAAKCPGCGRYFCRECITEHEDRVLCARCLRKTVRAAKGRLAWFEAPFKVLQIICGSILLWIFFYYLGLVLLNLPSTFHENSLWKSGF